MRMTMWDHQRQGRQPLPGQLIGHSDTGSQYTSIRFTDHCQLEGVRPSIGLVGDAFDNALMETLIGLYKTDCIRTTIFEPGPFRTTVDFEYADTGWLDWYATAGC